MYYQPITFQNSKTQTTVATTITTLTATIYLLSDDTKDVDAAYPSL